MYTYTSDKLLNLDIPHSPLKAKHQTNHHGRITPMPVLYAITA
jgi:hypothetical protein